MATDRRTDVMLLFALPLHLKQILNTGHTQKNGAVLIVNTIKTAPFFCVCPVHRMGGGTVVDWIHLAEYMDQWLTCVNMCP